MKHKLLSTLILGLAFALGACSLGGETSQSSVLPWGGNSSNSSAPIFGSSSSSSQAQDTYTVTFYVDSRVYATQDVKKGYTVSRPEDPYKSGYRFLRWEDKDGTRWNFSTDTVWSNVSLYAVFEQEGYSSVEPSLPYYTVRFFVGGEIYDMQEVKEGYNAVPPNDPYIEGYNFLGWAEVGYADYWNFARGVYYNLDLEARFEDVNDYTLTLYGTFTDWKTYSEYERKPGYGFPMVWEGIYFQAKTSFAFRQVYGNGTFRNLGWWDLADNSCPHVECESDAIPSIRVKEDVTLSFEIYQDLTIHIVAWETASSSSDPYGTSSEPYYPPSSESYPSSSDSYYTSGGSSESELDYTLTLYGTFTDWKIRDEYERKPGNGFPMKWEGITFVGGTSFAFRLAYGNGDFRDLGWWDLADRDCPHVECESDAIPSIRAKEDVELSFAIYEDLTIHITGWYTPSSSSGSYDTSEGSSGERATATLTVNRDNWTKTDEYVRYLDEGYPIVWEDLDINVGDEFYITVYHPGMGGYHYGWSNLDSGAASSGYFVQTTGGIQAMFGGVYSITFTNNLQIYVSGWEGSSSSYNPSSSETSYTSESAESSVFESSVTLMVMKHGWARTDEYSRSIDQGFPIVFEDITIDQYDQFKIRYERADDVILYYGYSYLDSASMNCGRFQSGGDGIQDIYGGTYSISFDAAGLITITGWEEQPPSSEPSTSESSTSEPSAFRPGYYLVGTFNMFELDDSYYCGGDFEDYLAAWEYMSIPAGHYFAIRHLFEDGHTFDLGYSCLLTTASAYSCFGPSEGSDNIHVLEPGEYTITLTNREQIDVSRSGEEASSEAPATCTVTFFVDNEVYDQQTVGTGALVPYPSYPTIKDGRYLDHWEDAAGNVWDITKHVYSDVTLYAVFLNAYTITLDLNGGTYDGATTLTAIEGKPFTLPTPIAPLGMEFSYWWYEGSALTSTYNYGKDITVVAQYTDPYSYLLTNEDGAITGYYGAQMRYLDAPAYIRGVAVSGIAANAFQGEEYLQEVILPAAISTLGAFAFQGCENLRTLRYNGTVDSWAGVTKGENWISGCPVTTVICSDGTVDLENSGAIEPAYHGPEGSELSNCYILGDGFCLHSWTVEGGIQLWSDPSDMTIIGCVMNLELRQGDIFKLYVSYEGGGHWGGYPSIHTVEGTEGCFQGDRDDSFVVLQSGFYNIYITGSYDIYILPAE